uniref:Mitochondrial DNA polymerase catalytic subunit n=1 Tax=Plectus sambesii TaxID=2011161 RepID=A0A914VI25_9BILA
MSKAQFCRRLAVQLYQCRRQASSKIIVESAATTTSRRRRGGASGKSETKTTYPRSQVGAGSGGVPAASKLVVKRSNGSEKDAGRISKEASNAKTTTVSDNNPNKQSDQPTEEDIEMISADLHRLLFPQTEVPMTSSPSTAEIFVPGLMGSNLREHFEKLGSDQIAPYRNLLDSVLGVSLPPPPAEWRLAPGWTCYDRHTGAYSTVDYPPDDALFFDVEVCVPDGLGPTMAVAASPKAWYSWCSRRLVDPTVEKPAFYRINDMIPLGGEDRPRIVVGHNVAFDRTRVREQYDRKPPKMRFWDTMSMHISMYGMGDRQLIQYQMTETDDALKQMPYLESWKEGVSRNSLDACHQFHCRDPGISQLDLDKSDQKFFVNNSLPLIRDNFQRLVNYCANDVQATFEIFQRLHPKFKERCPHPVTWFGMMELGSAYLPITDNWRKFIERAEETCTSSNNRIADQLVQVAHELINQFGGSDKRYLNDPWMWCEDWTPISKKSQSPKWFKKLCKGLSLKEMGNVNVDERDITSEDVSLRALVIPRIFGLCWNNYPLHHMAKSGWGYLVPDDTCTTSDKLVSLRRGDKVQFPRESLRAVIAENKKTRGEKSALEADNESETQRVVRHRLPGFKFVKLAHPDGKETSNVGNPLSKPFHKFIKDGTLWATRHQDLFREMADRAIENSYWISNRSRVNEQLTVWFDNKNTQGAIVPSICPAGTVTRRAVEKLWLTASNPKKDRVGSELKSMVEAPPGFVFVGADVDSQEQWVAAVLGDSYVGTGKAGATPFSRMVLAGRKEDGSDLHSVVARDVGISRDHAKTLNYARLYGSGVQHTQQFLQENIDADRRSEIADIAHLLFQKTKGDRKQFLMLHPELTNQIEYYLNNVSTDLKEDVMVRDGRYGLPANKWGQLTESSKQFFYWFAERLSKEEKINAKKLKKEALMKLMFPGDKTAAFWTNGYESEVFNCLERMADDAEPRTPVLGCRLSDALIAGKEIRAGRQQFLDTFKRTRVNWVVQSSAVDFLHLLLSSMFWLCKEYKIDARFAISIHDEIRYLVAEKDKYRCALALQLSNLYVRAMVSHSLDINQLPKSVAFFSKVDIDRVLRKEVDMESITPSNPQGMTKGYGIPAGEALSLDEIAQIIGGKLSEEPIDKRANEKKAGVAS